MANYLYKLGKWAVNQNKKVIGGTIGILIIITIAAISLGPSFSEDMSLYRVLNLPKQEKY